MLINQFHLLETAQMYVVDCLIFRKEYNYTNHGDTINNVIYMYSY